MGVGICGPLLFNLVDDFIYHSFPAQLSYISCSFVRLFSTLQLFVFIFCNVILVILLASYSC